MYLSEKYRSLGEIEEGHYDILLTSPETILGRWGKTVIALAEHKLLGAIFIDKAHCIRRLYEPLFSKMDIYW